MSSSPGGSSSVDSSTPPNGLRVNGVSKRFADTLALDDVSLEIPDGHMLVLLGPSGCGKTTLLRIIAGLERPDAGVVVVKGDELVGPGVFVPPERRRIGMVFQDWALFPHLTVERNVGYGLTREQVQGGRVAETLELVDMGHLAHRKPDELSAGQAQRVALARALAPRPRLLLFDEPFSSLDAELRVSVRREVADLMRAVEMTAVFVTHDQEEAFVLGDDVAVMNAGRIVQIGSPARIYSDPSTAWLAGFVGDANLLPGIAGEDSATTVFGQVPTRGTLRGKCRVLARPEHLQMTDGTRGQVVDVDFFGHDTTYRVQLPMTSGEPDQGPGPAGNSPGVSGRGADSGAEGMVEYSVRAPAAPRFKLGDLVDLSYIGPETVVFAVPGENSRK